MLERAQNKSDVPVRFNLQAGGFFRGGAWM
jgi:hypothetical protein